jgi:hypothetical protein
VAFPTIFRKTFFQDFLPHKAHRSTVAMASKLLYGPHLFQVLSLINNNFEVLKDALHNRNRGMAQADFTSLRNTIFDILRTRVDSRVTRLWDANTSQHYVLDSRLDQGSDWVHLYGIQCPHLVCQLFLLNDWNLNYSFTMKGNQFENTGLPLWMVHAARKTEIKIKLVTTLKSPLHTIPPRRPIRAHAAQQQPSSSGSLFHSPTTRGVQRSIYHRSETYISTSHRAELRRPTALAQQYECSDSSATRPKHDFAGLSTSHLSSVGLLFTDKPINPTMQSLLVARSIESAKQGPKKAITWPSEEADRFHNSKAYQPANRLGALDFLPRVSQITPDMLERTFGNLVMAMCTQAAEELPTPECRHCSAILSTNIMIARERMMPSKQTGHLRWMAIHRFGRLGHNEMRPTAFVTVDLPVLSFEQKMRNIAFQLDAITSRADEESRNPRLSTSSESEDHRILGDVGNRPKDIFQQENRRLTTLTGSITRTSPRTNIDNTPMPGMTVRVRTLPRM